MRKIDPGATTLTSDKDHGGAPLHCVFSGDFAKGAVRATAEIFVKAGADGRSAIVVRAE